MAHETRSISQIEANKLDLAIFNVARSIETFAEDCVMDASKRGEMRRFANDLRSKRYLIRVHMHKSDCERTA